MKQEKVQDRVSFKVSILSISFFLMMAQAIAPALPLMYNAFPGVDKAGVETLQTVPNIGIVVGLLISPFLVKLMGQKPTVLTGLNYFACRCFPRILKCLYADSGFTCINWFWYWAI